MQRDNGATPENIGVNFSAQSTNVASDRTTFWVRQSLLIPSATGVYVDEQGSHRVALYRIHRPG
jgi:hypothetical protein